MRFCLYVLGLLAVLSLTGAELESSQPRNVAAAAVPHIVSVVRLDARTRRLVRSVVVTPRPDVTAEGSGGMRLLVEAAAKEFEVDPELIDSVIQVESNYNPYAISPKGAQGLMQLMPQTARRFGVRNVFDPKDNREGGVKYLKFLQDTFRDDRLAVAAYNAGEGAVAKYGDVPPFKETVEYVGRVSKNISRSKQPAPIARKPDTGTEQAKLAEEHPKLEQYVDKEGRLYLVTR
jgi:soluble lytic murein transglycosylase-like protein